MKTPLTRTKKHRLVMDIYCYEPVNKMPSLHRAWTSVCFSFNMSSSRAMYKLHRGTSEYTVFSQRDEPMDGWLSVFALSPGSSVAQICLAPLKRSCVAVDTLDEYQLQLDIAEVDKWLFICFIAGVLLFCMAADVSRNVVLYYMAGVSLGVLTSLLILCFLFTRLFPKNTNILVMSLATGSSVTVWLLRTAYSNLSLFVGTYRDYAMVYVIVSSIASFAICYYRGPITEPRALDLIKWALQGIAFLLIYAGCQIPALASTVIIMLITIQSIRWFCRTEHAEL